MSNEESPLHRRQPSVDDVGTLIARAQRLVDSRPRDGYSLTWCVEAAYLGDLTAMAMVAAGATGRDGPRSPVRSRSATSGGA
jgi:hypothetical protein